MTLNLKRLRQDFMSQRKESVSQFYENHYRRIYNFFLKKLRSHEDAADGVQEVFMRLIRHNGTAGPASPDGYIWRATQNLVREIRRSRAIRARWMAPQSKDFEEQVSEAPDPEKALEIQQIQENALQVLNKTSTPVQRGLHHAPL